MADTSNDKSGSRWEPEHVTEDLTPKEQPTEVIPGLAQEPTAPAPAPKKRIPKAAAAIAIVAAATIGGGAIGLALAGNRSEPVSDTAVTSESTAGTSQGQGTAPDGTGTVPDGTTDRDGYGPGYGDTDGDGYGPGGFGHHGPGGH